MNDDELLEESGKAKGDTELANAFYAWKASRQNQELHTPWPSTEIPKDELPPLEYKRRDGMLGEFMDYMGGHPVSSAVNFFLPMAFKPKNVWQAPASGAMLGTQLMADPLGALEETLIPSFEPGAWDNTIWYKMKQDANRPNPKLKESLIENSDDLQKTFEPMRP